MYKPIFVKSIHILKSFLLLGFIVTFKRMFVFVSQGAKVFNYAKWHRTANGMFVVFTPLFMVTRLVIFPFW